MALRIAILGAPGAVGDMLAAELLHEICSMLDRLSLVGRGMDSNEDGLPRSSYVRFDLITRGFTSTSFPTLPSSRSRCPCLKRLLHPGNDHVSG
jgi:hypothetical protein